jgi:type I restriction enzyme, S subunit
VLVSVRAPVGSLNVAMEDCAIGRGLSSLRLRRAPGSFLFYFLQTQPEVWEKFEAGGTVFGCANKADIHDIPLVAPPTELIYNFNKIAGPIDTKIWSNELESRCSATIRDTMLPKLLSGEIRVKHAEKFLEAQA